MKVVVAVDSFKGSLSSMQAGSAIKTGVQTVYPQAEVIIKPLADGGEGTVDALVEGLQGIKRTVQVSGPLGETISAEYGILPERQTAIIEMAAAAGLTLVPVGKRDPRYTTTYGLGELIKHALSDGCKHFIIGIGGSATNDAGIGMSKALGVKFLNVNGEELAGIGNSLKDIHTINTDSLLPELADCNFQIACDVNNPLYGTKGAAYIYGPQKGATPDIVQELDKGLQHFSGIVSKHSSKDFSQYAGSGAAGGLGFAFISFLNAKLKSGIQIVLEEIKLNESLKDADFLITGEGGMDYQTAMGKAPIGVAKLGKQNNLKVLAFAGTVSSEARQCNIEGIDAYFSIMNSPVTLQEALDIDFAASNLTQTVIQVFNLIKTIS